MPRKKSDTLLSLLDERVRDIAPVGADADLLLRLQTAFARGLEAGKALGGGSGGSPAPAGASAPKANPADAKAAEREAKKQREEEARNACLEVYMDAARLMLPGVPDEVLLDALENDAALQNQFQTGHVPGERARIGTLRRVFEKRQLVAAPTANQMEGVPSPPVGATG